LKAEGLGKIPSLKSFTSHLLIANEKKPGELIENSLLRVAIQGLKQKKTIFY